MPFSGDLVVHVSVESRDYQWILVTLSLGAKRPGRETDHSPPSTVEMKNERSDTSNTPYALMTCHGQIRSLFYVSRKDEHAECFCTSQPRAVEYVVQS